jgi:organic radical activating enzyme
LTPEDLIRRVNEQAHLTNAMNICLTGGEPFIQPRGELERFVHKLRDLRFGVECFSNGSVFYADWVFRDLYHIMMDWKLKGSGEQESYLARRLENAKKLRVTDGIKFVVKDRRDLLEAREMTLELSEQGVKVVWWVGAAWGQITDIEIIDFVLSYKMPWRHNTQVHKHIWEPEARGV